MSLQNIAGLQFEDRFNELEITLLKLLNQHNVSYLLIGSVAAAFYGARAVEDSTNDMDFLYLHSTENAKLLLQVIENACREIGHCCTISDPGLLATPKRQLRLCGYYCEFLSASSIEVFEEMNKRATLHNVKGQKLNIAAVSDLIEMKRLALSVELDIDQKHQKDIESLIKLLPTFTPPAA